MSNRKAVCNLKNLLICVQKAIDHDDDEIADPKFGLQDVQDAMDNLKAIGKTKEGRTLGEKYIQFVRATEAASDSVRHQTLGQQYHKRIAQRTMRNYADLIKRLLNELDAGAGAATVTENSPVADAFDEEEIAILRELYNRKPLLQTLVQLEASVKYTRKTIGKKITGLMGRGYVERPNGKQGGGAITPAGERAVSALIGTEITHKLPTKYAPRE